MFILGFICGFISFAVLLFVIALFGVVVVEPLFNPKEPKLKSPEPNEPIDQNTDSNNDLY